MQRRLPLIFIVMKKKVVIKKAQSGVKIDKTSVSKPDARKEMKRANEADLRNAKNTAAYHKNQSDKSTQAARSFLMDDNREMYEFAKGQASKQDSLSKVASNKVKSLKSKPRFPVKKSGGNIKK